MIRDQKLDAIAGQIRHAIGDIDQRIRELRETCSDSVTTELAVRALGEARRHLQMAGDIVQIEER